jgi:S-adenosylmethionine hydrolase
VSVPLITFLSDFGSEDWFVGAVHGVIAAICPEARVVDVTHAIPPGAIERGAFVLEAAAGDFAPGTIHLAVVDPGVGTARRALAVRARGQLFVGPDNGLLDWALADPACETRSLTDARYFRHPVSRTFHGRDVFGPVAAHLARGTAFAALGPVIGDPVRLPSRRAHRDDGAWIGQVMIIDRFGNALTNLSAEHVVEVLDGAGEEALVVHAGGRRITGLSRSYGDAPVGTIVAVLGSSGRLEIAQVGGDVSQRYGIGLGDPVRITKAG